MAGNTDENRTYTCQQCGETLTDASELESHMEDNHPEVAERPEESDPAHRNEFTCVECGESFESQSDLDSHQSAAH